MNNHNANQEHTDDKNNSGNFNVLSNDMHLEIADRLPLMSIQHFRDTCRFFNKHPLLKQAMEKKTLRVITMESHTFWFKNGKVFGSGSNYFNILGRREGIDSCFKPTEIVLPNGKPIARIIPGHECAFYFDTEGNCYFCGLNICAKLEASDNVEYSFKTMRLPNGRPIVNVAAGHTSSFLCDDEGTWYAMGFNDSGKLGINSQVCYTCIPIPVSLPNGLAINKIVLGQSNSFFQDIKGNWFSCGNGNYIGKSGSQYVPESYTLPDSKPIAKIVTRLNRYFICNNEGQWYACGENFYGELGVSSRSIWGSTPLTQIQLPNGKSISKIVTSGTQTFMSDVDGQWFACGANHHGQLSLPKCKKTKLTPIELPNHKPIIEVHTGSYHTLFKDNEGNWYGCGSSNHGQLGISEQADQLFYIVPSEFENEKTEEIEISPSSIKNG